jgi:hydroxyethylthiazole kinase-like uncharacterized protein yjeF
VLLAAGPGDNGGDGRYAAAWLARRGAQVTVWAVADKRHAGGWAAVTAAGARVVDAAGALAALGDTDVVIDAVFGIGARGGLPEDVAAFAAACARCGVAVVAADVPSGLVADGAGVAEVRTVPARSLVPRVTRRGQSPVGSLVGSFAATRTVAFGAWKPCHVLQPAREFCGARRLVDIGLDLGTPYALELELSDLELLWPWPQVTDDKYSRGVVGIDTGSEDYPGAAVLGVLGAVHAGAGYVKYIGPARREVLAAAPNVVCPALEQDQPAWPGLVLNPGFAPLAGIRHIRADAWLVGSGWGGRGNTAPRLAEILDQGVPVVADAEAIASFAPDAGSRPGDAVVLTPHAGELARLLGVERAEVESQPVACVQRAAAATGATVLLKGATQYVATPGDPVTYLCFPGPAWTAQAGSGDVLAGIAVTLLAAGLTPRDAALLAGSIQALAAVQHPGPYPPQALARKLPQVIAGLRARG